MFAVCRLVSRRCHNILSIAKVAPQSLSEPDKRLSQHPAPRSAIQRTSARSQTTPIHRRMRTHCVSPLAWWQCFLFVGRQTVGTFAPRALPLLIANRCGVPVPITRDAAICASLFILIHILGYYFARCPKSPCSSLAWLLACRCASRCCLRLRGGSRYSSLSYRLFRLRPT